MNLTKLTTAIKNNVYNPENIFLEAYKAMADNDTPIPEDSTNPIVNLLETAIVLNTVSNDELDRRTKSKMKEFAQNIDQLAEHIDFNDIPNLRANPSILEINLLFLLDELLEFAIPVSSTQSKIVIPKETKLTFNSNLTFGLFHDIELIIDTNKNVDAIYVSNDNPIYEFNELVIDTRLQKTIDLNGFEVLYVELPIKVHQFTLHRETFVVTKAVGFKQSFTLTDDYSHARVFTRHNGIWVETVTAISDFIYSPYGGDVTSVIVLDGKKVTIEIPDIYFSREMVGSEVKVELISTKGLYTEEFNGNNVRSWSIDFINNDSNIHRFVNPLKNLTAAYAYTETKPLGGKVAPTFNEIRSVVEAGNTSGQPITEKQLRTELNGLGYDLTYDRNYLADSVYLASKPTNPYDADGVSTLVNAGNLEIILDDLDDKHGVIKNGFNFTITPSAVAKYNGGTPKFLTKEENKELLNLNSTGLVELLNKDVHLQSPFYYTINKNEFDVTVVPYQMDDPILVRRSYEGSNPSLKGKINTQGVSIKRTTHGYVLDLWANITSPYDTYPDDAFIPQLTFRDGYNSLYSVNGKFTTRTKNSGYVFTFVFVTAFEIDLLKGIKLNNVTNATSSDAGFFKLETTFDLTYNLVKKLPDLINETFKEKTDKRKITIPYMTNTHETITLKLGEELDQLYTPVMSLNGRLEYKKHQEDVLAFWTTDIFKKDNDGFLVTTPNPDYDDSIPDDPETNSPLLYTKLYRKGDPVMNGDTQALRHRKGDLVYDEMNQPIPLDRGGLRTKTRITFVDYKFGLVGEMAKIRGDILDNINSTLKDIVDDMLGLTTLKFNLGNSLVGAGVRYNIDSIGSIPNDVSMTIKVIVSAITYQDAGLRKSIERLIKDAVISVISDKHFSMNKLIRTIDSRIGNSVDSFDVVNINGNKDVINWTLLENSDKIGIRSELAVRLSDGSLYIKDGIVIDFVIA